MREDFGQLPKMWAYGFRLNPEHPDTHLSYSPGYVPSMCEPLLVTPGQSSALNSDQVMEPWHLHKACKYLSWESCPLWLLTAGYFSKEQSTLNHCHHLFLRALWSVLTSTPWTAWIAVPFWVIGHDFWHWPISSAWSKPQTFLFCTVSYLYLIVPPRLD